MTTTASAMATAEEEGELDDEAPPAGPQVRLCWRFVSACLVFAVYARLVNVAACVILTVSCVCACDGHCRSAPDDNN